MIMHEECLQGNFESIEKLRMSVPITNALSQSKRVIFFQLGVIGIRMTDFFPLK